MGEAKYSDDPTLVVEFISESLEHLDGIDNDLYEYEKDPSNEELIDSIFRAIHSVKGASGFLGFGDINRLAHRLETLLDLLRKGEKSPDNTVMDTLFSGCDLLRTLIEDVGANLDQKIEQEIGKEDERLNAVMDSLNRLMDSEGAKEKEKEKKDSSDTKEKGEGYRISEKMLTDFQIEASEHLEACDEALIRLDKQAGDREAINDFFRAIHSIKGTSAYLGQEEISSLSHALESMLELVRRKDRPAVSDDLLDLAFQTVDLLRSMVEDLNDQESRKKAQELRSKILDAKASMQSGGTCEGASDGAASVTDPVTIFKDAAKQHIDTIRACIDKATKTGELGSSDIDILFRAVHSLKSSANYMGMDKLVRECALFEDVLNEMKKGTLPFGPAIADMALDTISSLEAEIESVDTPAGKGETCEEKKEALPEQDRRDSREPVSVASPKKPSSGPACSQNAGHVPKTMRIDQRLLDVFMNLVGELIVSRNALGHVQRQLAKGEVGVKEAIKGLQKATQTITRISDEMQRSVMEMRMVPVRNVFQKFPRIVRDICRKTGKKVDLILQGEDTEIDKGIAEEIGDPLVHIIRNSMDHGIELPDERIKKGKPETGTIVLKAYHEGNYIIIDVIDDGAGINPEAVLAKAIENGMITKEAGERMNKEEILNLIFMPGFSTAKQVTDISGRGVGMDVVRTNLAKLKGNVRVSSEVGEGTHIRLEVPLTLALVEAMLVGAGGNTFAIPVESVRETLKISPADVNTLMAKRVIVHRGTAIGLQPLAELLNVSGNGAGIDREEDVPVLIIQAANETLAIAVEKLYRKEEIVIKPLADYLAQLPGIAGASILGDGQTILILEPNELVAMAVNN